MDLFEVIAKRRSVRMYTATPVEPEKLQAILRAANAAPSAGNLQGYEIYVAGSLETRKALAQAAWGQDFLAQAPVALVFCTNPARSGSKYRQRGVELYSVQDATIACTFAMLAATALGLATVWVGAFDPRRVREIIGAPEPLNPVAILPVGYPAEAPEPAGRRRLEDLVHKVR
jgi:nitroreductase